MLTILGYSINDTVVIYDRIRENTGLYGKKMSLPELVNLSINQSFGRSMMTSITTCIALAIVCVVSIIFKLDSIFTFAVPLLFGMASCGSAIRPARLPPPPRKRKPGGTLLCVARTAVPMNPR